VSNVSTNVYAKFFCAPLRIKKALGILDPGELIPTTRRTTTRVAFWDPPSGSKNKDGGGGGTFALFWRGRVC